MWRRWLCGFEQRLLRELQRQQEHASLFCDTMLQADGVSIPVHSCVLAAFSPQLARTLSAARVLTSGQGRLLQLQSIRAQTLLKLVGLLYSGELQGEGELEQEEVLAVASWLGIENLVEVNGTGKEGVEVGGDGWAQHMKKMCREEEPVSRTKGDVDTLKERGWGRGSGDASRNGGTVALSRTIQVTERHRVVKGGLSEHILENITSAEASTMTLSDDVTAAPLGLSRAEASTMTLSEDVATVPLFISQAKVSITRNDICSRNKDGEVDKMEARDIAKLETIEQREEAGDEKTMVGRKRRGGHLVGTRNNIRVRGRQISKIKLRRQSRAELWEIVSTREQDVTIKPRPRCPMVKAGHWSWQSDLQESQAVVNSSALNMAQRPHPSPSRLHASSLCVSEDVTVGLGVLSSAPEKPNSAHACRCQPHRPQNRSPPSAGLPTHWMPEVSMGASSAGGTISGVVMVPRPQHSMGTADALHTPSHILPPHNLPFVCCMDNTDNMTASQTCSSLARTSEPHLALTLACSQITVDRVQDGNLQSMPTPVLATGLHCSTPRGQSSEICNFTGPVKQTNKVLNNVVACAPKVFRQVHTMQIPSHSLSLRAISGDKTDPEEPTVPAVSLLESTLNLNVFIAEEHYKMLQDPSSSHFSHETPEQSQTTGPSSQLHNAILREPLQGLAGIYECLMQSSKNEFPNQCLEKSFQSPGEGIDAIQDREREQDSEVSELRDATLLNWCRSNVNISHGFWNNILLGEPFKRTSSCDWQSADGNISRPPNVCPLMVNDFHRPKEQGLTAFASHQAKLLPQMFTSLHQTNDFKLSAPNDMPNLNMWHREMDRYGEREKEINTETRRDSCVKRKAEKQKQCEVLRHKKTKVDDYIFSPMSITEKLIITEIKMPVKSSGGVGGLSAVRRLPRQSPNRHLTYVSKIQTDSKTRECYKATGDSRRLYQKTGDKCKCKTVEKVNPSERDCKRVKESLIETTQDRAMVGHLRKGRSNVCLLPSWKLSPMQGSQVTCSSKSVRSDCPEPRSQRELAVILAENQNLGLHTEPEEGCDTLGRKGGMGEINMVVGDELGDLRSGDNTVKVGHDDKTLWEGERKTELKNTNGIQPRKVLKKVGTCLTKTERLKTGERKCLNKNKGLMKACRNHILQSVGTGNGLDTKDVAGEVDAMEAGMTNNKLTGVSEIERTEMGGINQTTKIKEKEVRCEEIIEEAEAGGKGRVKYRLETREQGEEKSFRIYQKSCVEVIESGSEKSSENGMDTKQIEEGQEEVNEVIESRFEKRNSEKGTDTSKQKEEGQEEVDIEVIEMRDGENGCDSGGVDEYPMEDQILCTFTKPVLEDEEIDIIDFSSPPAVLLNQLPVTMQVDISPRESSEDDQEIDVIT
nr:uncharacterized protein LOC111861054 [Paramormyrops kingsleyae]XP_023701101.1 uncharacterized protein LOC111861054 [Paramormyrops kingsleyae]XP_023701102.1 uncharacterized protein LOC111861054 [Paramormyrops kingsleyae]XP_023701104.1 uncharacterized protein LOC111861054 [Paramormyrops kingsleyae]XP_023701105.1 uncharacterized protein LOC111861054 [Paramormyrops kingsleyae]